MTAEARDTRKADLAKIHIAKKDLALDDDTYRAIIRDIGKSASGSSADLTPLGRARVLAHLKSKGFKTRRAPRQQPNDRSVNERTPSADRSPLATDGEIATIRAIWIKIADSGAVRDRSETALRAWVQATTRRYHPQHAGYSALQFMPSKVAQRVIEHIKQWARRLNIDA